jgi:hypothetical protein
MKTHFFDLADKLKELREAKNKEYDDSKKKHLLKEIEKTERKRINLRLSFELLKEKESQNEWEDL